MNLASLLSTQARRRPEHVAVVADGERLTYAALAGRVETFARALLLLGVAPGDRVVVCLDNGIANVVTVFAVWRIGAVVVLVHPSTTRRKLALAFTDSAARAGVVDAHRAREVVGLRAPLASATAPPVVVIGVRGARGPARAQELAALAHDLQDTETARFVEYDIASADIGAGRLPLDEILQHFGAAGRAAMSSHAGEPAVARALAAIIYTSGSTGDPKGVMHSHGSLGAATNAVAGFLALCGDDVVMQVMPSSSSYGLTQLLTAMSAGATLILERGIPFARAVVERIGAERVTGIAVVPTIATLLLEAGLDAASASMLRFITNAGAAMPPSLTKRLRAAIPDAALFLMYGQTECVRASFLAPREVDAHPASVGVSGGGGAGGDSTHRAHTALPDTTLWIADTDRRPLEGPAFGELVVVGPQVMVGYWRRPHDTASKLRTLLPAPGAAPAGALPMTAERRELFTGDLFRRDDAGFLHFVTRSDDVIVTRGEKVSPREVEDAILSMPGVTAAAVVAVDDAVLGQAVKAFVVTSTPDDMDAHAIRAACSLVLEEWAVPKHVSVVPDLPRDPSGKIDKRALNSSSSAATEGRRVEPALEVKS